VSEDSKQIALVPHADFTVKDLETIDKFKENGLLGLHTITEVDVERCMGLYVDGKSYRQIANITKIKKDVILFLAHKFSWFDLRQDYLAELQATMKEKILDAKLQNQEFLFDLIMAYRKKLGKNINKYLKSDNEEWIDKVDSKDMSVIFKCMELLEKLNAETYDASKNNESLGTVLNDLGDGMTITKTVSNTVEITPKSPFSSKLKSMADFKRQQEKESQSPPKTFHDIEVQTSTTVKESEDKNESK